MLYAACAACFCINFVDVNFFEVTAMKNNKNKNPDGTLEVVFDRVKEIIVTSVIGIITNILLAGFKAVIGIITGSIAIVLDGVNNLSDALSSIITIVGTLIAGRKPNKKHPYGYGRVEYLTAIIISAIVLYAGITSMTESIKKIINPVKPEYSVVSLVIIGVAILVKILLGKFVGMRGKKLNSAALEASGKDALMDAVLSASVFATAIIFVSTKISLEAYVGVIISVVIIKSAIEMMIDTINDILGERADYETSRRIKALLCEEPEIRGAYDLFINNYGPGTNYASVHIELPDTMTVDEVDSLTRRVQMKVYKETGIMLVGVGVYSYNTVDENVISLRDKITEIVLSHEWAIQMHGFYFDKDINEIRFDVVMSFDIFPLKGIEIIKNELSEKFPEYQFNIVPDIDISD